MLPISGHSSIRTQCINSRQTNSCTTSAVAAMISNFLLQSCKLMNYKHQDVVGVWGWHGGRGTTTLSSTETEQLLCPLQKDFVLCFGRAWQHHSKHQLQYLFSEITQGSSLEVWAHQSEGHTFTNFDHWNCQWTFYPPLHYTLSEERSSSIRSLQRAQIATWLTYHTRLVSMQNRVCTLASHPDSLAE